MSGITIKRENDRIQMSADRRPYEVDFAGYVQWREDMGGLIATLYFVDNASAVCSGGDVVVRSRADGRELARRRWHAGAEGFAWEKNHIPFGAAGYLENWTLDGQPIPDARPWRKFRETKSARIEFRARPSLKTRAEAIAERKNQSLSDYAHDLIEAAVARAERQARKAA